MAEAAFKMTLGDEEFSARYLSVDGPHAPAATQVKVREAPGDVESVEWIYVPRTGEFLRAAGAGGNWLAGVSRGEKGTVPCRLYDTDPLCLLTPMPATKGAEEATG